MSSGRQVISAMALALVLIAVPWTASASSQSQETTGRSSVTATIILNVESSEIEYEIEFDEVEIYGNYIYELNFTRVDPCFNHLSITSNISAVSNSITIADTWTPEQDGPYTLKASLYDTEKSLIVTTNYSFEWGDATSNSAPIQGSISFTPDLEYYDIFNNQTLYDEATISFGRENREYGAAYKGSWKIYRTTDDGEEYLSGEGAGNWGTRTLTMNNLDSAIDGWEDNTEYKLKLWTYRVDEGVNIEVDYAERIFRTGVEPQVPQLVNLDLMCASPSLGDSMHNWDFTYNETIVDWQTNEYNCSLYNFNYVPISAVFSVSWTGAKDFDIGGLPSSDEKVNMESYGEFNLTLYPLWGADGPNETDGSFSILIDISSESEEIWVGNSTELIVDFDFDYIDEIIVPEVIYGCMDSNATNYNQNATESDGSCIYPGSEPEPEPEPVPLNVSIEANRTSGEGPLQVSFTAIISGGIEPYSIEWEIISPTGPSSSTDNILTHEFAPGGHTVVLSVSDNGTFVATDQLEISVTEPPIIEPLTGYIVTSLQIEPAIDNMTGGMEFTGVASGGFAPYTFKWDFDEVVTPSPFEITQINTGETVLHEFKKAGNYTITLTVRDQVGEIFITESVIEIVDSSTNEDSGDLPSPDDNEIVSEELGLFIASTGGLCLLMVFGLAGRKRKEDLLEKLRNEKAGTWSHEENAMWDDSQF